jgi:serine protease inhibitor
MMHRTGSRAFITSVVTAAGSLLALLMSCSAHAQDGAAGQALLTKAYNASGQQLVKQFSTAATGNIVLSPYSIGTAMAMALAGARGETEREMAAVLAHRLKRSDIEAANADVMAILNGYDRSATPPSCPSGMLSSAQRCESAPMADGRCPFPMQRDGERCLGDAKFPPSAKLLTANALMLTRRGDLVSPQYAALLKDKYAAEVFQGAGLGDINGWVNRRTEGKIDRILERLDPDSAAVILNAVYFKARWASTFDVKDTKDDTFNISPSQKAQVPMMQRTGTYALLSRPGYRIIRLPYEVAALGMVMVLPEKIDGLGEVSRRIDASALSELFVALRATQAAKLVALAMPRFKTEFTAELVSRFQQAGMTKAFRDAEADFSGMTGKPPSEVAMAISQIVHRAMIEVAEEATEAAAATAIEMRAKVSAAPRPVPTPEPFRVDRPFLFYVVDDTTGAILFQGRTVDPRQALASR